RRDILPSAAGRILIPDCTIDVVYMHNRFTNVGRNLTVFPESMKRNIDKTYRVNFSQRVLLTLIDKGMSREDAYGIVQPLAMQAWEEAKSFQALLEGNSSVTDKLTPSELKD